MRLLATVFLICIARACAEADVEDEPLYDDDNYSEESLPGDPAWFSLLRPDQEQFKQLAREELKYRKCCPLYLQARLIIYNGADLCLMKLLLPH